MQVITQIATRSVQPIRHGTWPTDIRPGFLADSKYKIQALFKNFQGPKLHFSSTEIIDKKPYPTGGDSKFRLQRDTEVYCTVLTNTVTRIQVLASKLSTNAKFQNLPDLNSRTFQGFSSTFKCSPYLFSSTFKGLEVFIPNSSIFNDFSSTLWNPETEHDACVTLARILCNRERNCAENYNKWHNINLFF